VIHVGVRYSFIRLGGSLILVALVAFSACIVPRQHMFAMVHDQTYLLESGRKVLKIDFFALYRGQMTELAVLARNTRSVEKFRALGPPGLVLWRHVAHYMK